MGLYVYLYSGPDLLVQLSTFSTRVLNSPCKRQAYSLKKRER